MAKEFILSGNVQGVFCRAYCGQNARRLGISGSATNLPDGSVRVILDCDDEAAKSFIKALKNNPFNIRFYGQITNITMKDYSGSIRGDYLF